MDEALNYLLRQLRDSQQKEGSMIRWRFVLTRLIVIIAVLMLLRWGLGPVANFLTVRGLETVTGAKVEIAKTRVGLFPPRVQYVGFQIADPRAGKQMRDMFRATPSTW